MNNSVNISLFIIFDITQSQVLPFFFTLMHTKLLILCLWTGEEHGYDLSTGYTWKKGLFNILHAPKTPTDFSQSSSVDLLGSYRLG